MQLFFHPNIEDKIVLSETESTHCIRALRHQVGDKIKIANGKGQLFEGTLITDHPKKCEVDELVEVKSQPQSTGIHIAIAPTKNPDRMEWFVEKATEIGVTEITFLICEHSERRKVNADRLEKKAISALKQCQNLWLPTIHKIKSFDELLDNQSVQKGKYIASLQEKTTPLLQALASRGEQLILIGPEGDFSAAEIKRALDHQFISVSLGQNTLRTETAGIVACTILRMTNR